MLSSIQRIVETEIEKSRDRRLTEIAIVLVVQSPCQCEVSRIVFKLQKVGERQQRKSDVEFCPNDLGSLQIVLCQSPNCRMDVRGTYIFELHSVIGGNFLN